MRNILESLTSFGQFQVRRIRRITAMDARIIRGKLAQKLEHYLSSRRNVRRLAYLLDRYSVSLFDDSYCERPEVGPTNLETKLLRQSLGGPFEPYSISLINKAAVQFVGPARRILDIGCGTGMFSSFGAVQYTDVQFTASELDEKTLAWAREHRSAPNISFRGLTFEECSTDEFDLVVALEVIEHIFNYAEFLKALSRVAPRAIISTPNKSRDPFTSIANTPAYDEHVREWTAGELFWVLRCFYDDVEFYTLPAFKKQVARYTDDSSFVPTVKKCSVLEREEPLIAKCGSPRRK